MSNPCRFCGSRPLGGRGARHTWIRGPKKKAPARGRGSKTPLVEFRSRLFALRRHVARVDRRSTRNRQFKGPCGRRRSRLACPVNVSTGSGGQLNSSDRRRKNHCRVSDLSGSGSIRNRDGARGGSNEHRSHVLGRAGSAIPRGRGCPVPRARRRAGEAGLRRDRTQADGDAKRHRPRLEVRRPTSSIGAGSARARFHAKRAVPETARKRQLSRGSYPARARSSAAARSPGRGDSATTGSSVNGCGKASRAACRN